MCKKLKLLIKIIVGIILFLLILLIINFIPTWNFATNDMVC